MHNRKLSRFVVAAAATAAVGGGVGVAATSGSAGPAPDPRLAETVSTSVVVAQAASSSAAPRLDASRSRPVDMSRAPSGLASERYAVVPSDKGPCLWRQGGGETAVDLIEGDSLACGAGIAPTVSTSAAGTIGVVAGEKASVEVTSPDGSTVQAAIDSDGVWFAEPGAVKATISSEGSSEQVVDLALDPGSFAHE